MDITLTDPLGRSIALSPETWFGHILKFHPDLAASRQRVEQTVRSPLAIHFSTSKPVCRLYYSGPEGAKRMICVIANVESGFVLTAYICKRIKPGAREWPPPRPSRA